MNPNDHTFIEPKKDTDLQCRFCGYWMDQNKAKHFCTVVGREVTVMLGSEITH